MHIFFFFLYGLAPVEQWRNWLETGIVLNKAASRVSQVWAIILLVDAAISFSYVLFPKKEKEATFLGKVASCFHAFSKVFGIIVKSCSSISIGNEMIGMSQSIMLGHIPIEIMQSKCSFSSVNKEVTSLSV